MSENKITKRSDLFREYARVMDMAESAKIPSYSCIKYNGINLQHDPNWNGEIELYEFALAIVEDRPVFKGDVLWTKDSQQIIADTGVKHTDGYKIWTSDGRLFTCDFLSWQEPKRTITINGKEYPAPTQRDKNHSAFGFLVGSYRYEFDTMEDMSNVLSAIVDLLDGK